MRFVLACLLAAGVPLVSPPPAAEETPDFPGWPTRFEGRALKSLPLSEAEQRFDTGFPGRIARFTDGEREIVMRWVSRPTRKLHPAMDCFKGSGYAIMPPPLQTIAGATWSTFEAQRGPVRLQVRETIADSSGRRWTDMSAWYWSAMRDPTRGPWWAITVATSIASSPGRKISLSATRDERSRCLAIHDLTPFSNFSRPFPPVKACAPA